MTRNKDEAAPPVVSTAINTVIVEVPVVDESTLRRIEGLGRELREAIGPALGKLERLAAEFLPRASAAPAGPPPSPTPRPHLRVVEGGRSEPVPWPGTLLHKGHRKILDVLAQHKGRSVGRPELIEAAGYDAGSRALANYLSALLAGAMVVQAPGRRWAITTVGLAALGLAHLPTPLTRAERLERWALLLPGNARTMLRTLAAADRPIPVGELAKSVGMRARAGGFVNYVSMLRANGLAEMHEGGLRLAAWLLEGP